MVLWQRQSPRQVRRARRNGGPLGWAFSHPRLETLEARVVPATLSVGANVNVSRLPADQTESSIAINPTNPNEIVAVSNDFSVSAGIRVYRSTDGGLTWS